MELVGVELGLALLREARAAGVDVYMYGGRLAVWGTGEQWPLIRRLQRHELEVLAALQRLPVAREAWNAGGGDHDRRYRYREDALPELFGADGLARLAALRAARRGDATP